MARKTKEEAQKTYHLLLDSAVTLFARQGVSHTTLNDIAKKASLTRGAVYWHFENKEDVIKALWERDAAPTLEVFLQALSSPSTAGGRIHFCETIKQMLKVVVQNPKVSQAVRIVLNSAESTTHQTALQIYLEEKAMRIYHSILDALIHLENRAQLNPQYTPQLLAAALWSYLHGLVDNNMQTHIQQIDLKTDSDQLIDLFLGNFFR